MQPLASLHHYWDQCWWRLFSLAWVIWKFAKNFLYQSKCAVVNPHQTQISEFLLPNDLYFAYNYMSAYSRVPRAETNSVQFLYPSSLVSTTVLSSSSVNERLVSSLYQCWQHIPLRYTVNIFVFTWCEKLTNNMQSEKVKPIHQPPG